MHRLPSADNGNINAGWSAIPHCSRIAMHLKAPLSRATRLKKKRRKTNRRALRVAKTNSHKSMFASFSSFVLFFFFFCVISKFYSFERDTKIPIFISRAMLFDRR